MKAYHDLIRHSGNQDLFRAVEMSVAAIMNGIPFHIHAEGLRGTGKTSIMRAAKEVLPRILRIKGCIYNCDPEKPHCPQHRHLSEAEIKAIGCEEVPCPFLEISHAAKIGTIVGSIDLSQLTDPLKPAAALLPGTIPQAHRGIIFIDEINRLADTAPEIADVLLSVMGTKPGKIQIEESGLPIVDIPVSVAVWAASNPDEEPGSLSQIRRQLADRFDMVVPMGRPNDYQTVSRILSQQTETHPVQTVFLCPGLGLKQVDCSDAVKAALACVYVDFGLESLRALESVATGARLNALLAGRASVSSADLLAVVPSVLGHRTDSGTLANILKYLESLEKTYVKPIGSPSMEEAKYDHTPRIAGSSEENWLKKLWQRLRSGLPKPAQKAGSSGGSCNTAGKQNADRDQSPAKSGRGGAPSAPADPLSTNILAPATKATPLVHMQIDQFVSEGDGRPHDR